MRKANLLSGAVLLLFGLVLLIVIIPAQIEVGEGEEISARLLPNLCALVIIGLSALLIFSNWRKADREINDWPISRSELVALVITVALIVLGIYLFSAFGALPASIVLIVGLMLAMGERRNTMTTVIVPKGTSAEIIAKLEKAVEAASKDSDVIAITGKLNFPIFYRDAVAASAEMQSQWQGYGQLIKDTGFEPK